MYAAKVVGVLMISSYKNRTDAPTCPTFVFVLGKQPVILSSGSALFVIAPSWLGMLSYMV